MDGIMKNEQIEVMNKELYTEGEAYVLYAGSMPTISTGKLVICLGYSEVYKAYMWYSVGEIAYKRQEIDKRVISLSDIIYPIDEIDARVQELLSKPLQQSKIACGISKDAIYKIGGVLPSLSRYKSWINKVRLLGHEIWW